MNKKVNKKIKTKNINTKRLVGCLIVGLVLLILLIIRICWLQFIQGSSLREEAYTQQTTNRTIAPERGTIYDSKGKVLATSLSTDTVTVNPSNVFYDNDSEVPKEFLASYFSELFKLDYNETLEKLSSESTSVTIAKKVEKDTIDTLKDWLKQNDIVSGVNITEKTTRHYPYETLASSLIGFTGTDNQGLMGLENSLDSILAGTAGTVVTSLDSINGEIPNSEQTYVAAKNGSDVTLTIDVYIQAIADKYLEQAVIDNNADGGNVIIMNPNNGDILAMSTYPNYDLNTPFTPIDEEILKIWDTLSSEEQNDYLYSIWSNKAVQSTYEPGSTFKLITAATAIEENIITNVDEVLFSCYGSETVADRNIKCWRSYNPHGYQSLKQALGNSCNPAFIQLARKIGPETLYKYYEAFGLFEKTSTKFYGESNSIFHDLDSIGEVDLATLSFGQRFVITPLQMVTAISCIANEGTLVEPKIIKEITDTNTKSVEVVETNEIRQVLSKQTSETLMQMMDYVVTDGTGKYAQVQGYSIGGKSGTSEPIDSKKDEGYVASFIGVSPTSNAEVVILVAIYDPKGASYQGGQVAGPVVSQILSEVLPYLGITSSNTENTPEVYSSVSLADVRGKTISEAKQILANAGFNVIISGNEDVNATLITDQVPKPGTSLIKDSNVYLYTEANNERELVTVPNLKGLSVSEAINTLKANKLNIIIDGSGIVISQDISSGKQLEKGSTITVTMQEELSGGY